MRTKQLAIILSCCAFLVAYSSIAFGFPPANVSFYKVPLVCEAAPQIGCGSKAKPILKAIVKQKNVKEAWINREGTLLAVEWLDNSSGENSVSAINGVLTTYEIETNEISGTEREEIYKTFETRTNWLPSFDVDKLSKEEAGIIATTIVAKLQEGTPTIASFQEAYRNDIEKIFTDLFLSVSSIEELTTKKYRQAEKQIQKAGEKYVGKGKMPIYSLCPSGKPVCCEKGKSCSTVTDKSCCEKIN